MPACHSAPDPSQPPPARRTGGLAAALALGLGGIAGLAAPGTATAQTLAPARPVAIPLLERPLVRAELRPGWTTPDGTRMAALHLHLAEGWKTYWRIPGEAGIAPRIDFSGSQNLADVRLHWPRPVIFDQSGFRSIGYRGELVLPLELTPRRAGRPIALSVDLAIGVCDDICVPVDLTVTGALRGAGAADPVIQRALATTARPAGPAGLTRARCATAPTDRGVSLTLRAALPQQGRGEALILEMPGTGYWLSDQRSWREGGELIAQARVRAPGGAPVAIDRSAVSFTVLAPDQMLEHRGCTGD